MNCLQGDLIWTSRVVPEFGLIEAVSVFLVLELFSSELSVLSFFLKLASLTGFRSLSTHQIGYFSVSRCS